MSNEDITDLYDHIAVGTKVVVMKKHLTISQAFCAVTLCAPIRLPAEKQAKSARSLMLIRGG